MATSESSASGYLTKRIIKGGLIHRLLYGGFRFRSSKDVIFVKETSIELVEVDEKGRVQPVCDQHIFGIIRDLAVLPWNEKFHARGPQLLGKDLLVAISDSGKLSLLTFCEESYRFYPVKHVELTMTAAQKKEWIEILNPGNTRRLMGRRMLAIDSSGSFIAASPFEDRVALFRMSATGGDMIDKRTIYPSESAAAASTSRSGKKTSIPGGATIWSMCFISPDSGQPRKEHNPVLAIIVERMGENKLLLLEWNVEAQTTSVTPQYLPNGPLAHNILEVPNSHGLAFVFRAGDVLLMDFKDRGNPFCVYRTELMFLTKAMEEQTYVKGSNISGRRKRKNTKLNEKMSDYDPMCIDIDNGATDSGHKYICSWSWEPGSNEVPRMIFCAYTGEFFMITVFFDSGGPKVIFSECLYKGLPCKGLLWLEGGYLAAIVENGDGVVLNLRDGSLCQEGWCDPVIAPILDVAVSNCLDEKHDQMFACCGVEPEGSLRVIQSGISLEKPIVTYFEFAGVTGTWAVRMKVNDPYHSFLVLSFLGNTMILSSAIPGIPSTVVTASVGFQPDVSTLACGLVSDGLLVQIYKSSVKLCLPTKDAHSEGNPSPSPICTFWSPPPNMNISLGAVGHNFIVVSTYIPCFLFILGVRLLSAHQYEIYEMQRLEQQNELSCISIPRNRIGKKQSHSSISENNSCTTSFLSGLDINKTFVIGTYKPSVQIWSFDLGGVVTLAATAKVPLTSEAETDKTLLIPQDVQFLFVRKFYILAGLRNGTLLRFEWPAEPSDLPSVLQLVATHRIGFNAVFLVPLDDRLDADIVALSDSMPWLLHSAKEGLSCTYIYDQPVSHVTPICSIESPTGLLFVVENSIHQVEMVNRKRPMQKIGLRGTPRKVLYHNESQMLLVSRTERSLSDICFVDPLSRSVAGSFRLNVGETGRSMEMVTFGGDQLLVVGTSLFCGLGVKPNGEAVSARGRLLVFFLNKLQNLDSGSMLTMHGDPMRAPSAGSKPDENDKWQFRLAYETVLNGMVLAVCPYLDRYFLASAGNAFFLFGFESGTRLKVRTYARGETRCLIRSLTSHSTRIAVGDGSHGIIFFSYNENANKLEQLYSEPEPSRRLVTGCILMDDNTAVVSDRKGSIAVLCSDHLEDNASPERNLRLSCAYFMADGPMSLRKSSSSYRLPADDVLPGGIVPKTNVDSLQSTIIATTLLGSIIIFMPLSREEYKLLAAVQARLVVHRLTAPVLGNDHNEFRSRGNGNPDGAPKILDGDMLAQFLGLTRMQQNDILPSEPPERVEKLVLLLHSLLLHLS